MTLGLRIVVVRHGATALTGQVLNGGGPTAADPPLADVGMAQAAWAGLRLSEIGRPAAHLTSPALRARQTAAVMGYPEVNEPEAALAEVDFGQWEGRDPVAVRAQAEGLFARWWADPQVSAPGGTSLASVATRLLGLVESLVADAACTEVLLVGHASTVRVLAGHALRVPLAQSARLHTPPGAVAEMRFWPDGGSVLESLDWPRA